MVEVVEVLKQKMTKAKRNRNKKALSLIVVVVDFVVEKKPTSDRDMTVSIPCWRCHCHFIVLSGMGFVELAVVGIVMSLRWLKC